MCQTIVLLNRLYRAMRIVGVRRPSDICACTVQCCTCVLFECVFKLLTRGASIIPFHCEFVRRKILYLRICGSFNSAKIIPPQITKSTARVCHQQIGIYCKEWEPRVFLACTQKTQQKLKGLSKQGFVQNKKSQNPILLSRQDGSNEKPSHSTVLLKYHRRKAA